MNRIKLVQMRLQFPSDPVNHGLPSSSIKRGGELLGQLMVQVLMEERQPKESNHERQDSTESS